MIPSVDLLEPRRRRLIRWIGAATLISAIHIGGGSFAMLYGLEEFVEEAPGAIVVEIAPVATALESDMTAPLGKLSDEREATQAASDPQDQEGRGGSAERGPALAGRARGRAAQADAGRGEAQGRAQGGNEPAGARRAGADGSHQGHGTAARRCADRHQVGGSRRRHRGQQRAQHRVLAEFRHAANQPAQALSLAARSQATCRGSCTCAS